MGLILSWWKLLKTIKFATCSWLTHKWTTHERSHEKHMLEAEESSVRLYFVSHFATWLTREWPTKLSTWMILSVTLIPFTHTIYTPIIYKIECYSEWNLRKVSTTHPPCYREIHIFKREILVVSSFPISHCYTSRWDLYPNTIHTYSECRECFGTWEALGICQNKLCEAW